MGAPTVSQEETMQGVIIKGRERISSKEAKAALGCEHLVSHKLKS